MLFKLLLLTIPKDSRMHLSINGKGCFYGYCIDLEEGHNGDRKIIDYRGKWIQVEDIEHLEVERVYAYGRNVLGVDLRGEMK